MGRLAWLRSNRLPSLVHENTNINSLILLQWMTKLRSTLPLLVIVYCNSKKMRFYFSPLSYSRTCMCSHRIIVISCTSNWDAEPLSRHAFYRVFMIPAGMLSPNSQNLFWKTSFFFSFFFSPFFLSDRLLGAPYVCMSEEQLVGLNPLRPELTSDSFFNSLQTCLDDTKCNANFNEWWFSSSNVPQ